jgi:hypothetical protein
MDDTINAEFVASPRRFDLTLYSGELNRIVGSGGELLIKNPANKQGSPTKMEVGDCLIGIGATHFVESLSRPPGLDAFRAMSHENMANERKMAMRAFLISEKNKSDDGFDFRMTPLSPENYSQLLGKVSEGKMNISSATIPSGTMIISFVDAKSKYTLKSAGSSVAPLFANATTGERYWTVGLGKDDDFWEASFPSDDVQFLKMMDSAERVGKIKLGLSLLDFGVYKIRFASIVHTALGKISMHEFVLNGAAAGTKGLDSPFPIGLRTEIVCRPTD